VTRKERIRNKYVKGNIGIESIMNKTREKRLRWFGHVTRQKETKAVIVGYEN